MSTADVGDAHRKTVLLVEDSATQSLRLKLVLEEEGLQVLWAGTGRVGLKLAQQLHPDLIVLDVEMPEMNGFQVCRQLKEAPDTADIPVIMLTRHDDAEAVVLGLQAGVVDYIPKDAFADAVLLETLRQMGLIAKGTAA